MVSHYIVYRMNLVSYN